MPFPRVYPVNIQFPKDNCRWLFPHKINPLSVVCPKEWVLEAEEKICQPFSKIYFFLRNIIVPQLSLWIAHSVWWFALGLVCCKCQSHSATRYTSGICKSSFRSVEICLCRKYCFCLRIAATSKHCRNILFNILYNFFMHSSSYFPLCYQNLVSCHSSSQQG